MLAAKGMLKALSESENVKEYKDNNSDHDFSQVLKVCGGEVAQARKIRYADGQEKFFSFDD